MLDRLILALLAQPVALAFGVSDTAIGLLFGLGFGILYAVVGLPAAHFLDTRRRIPIIITGVLLWGAMTVLSGFATGFVMLVVARAGVAMGEAVLSPAAVSLLADLFGGRRRVIPTTIFTSVGAFMFAGAFVVGGGALTLATMLSPAIGLAPWRLTLMIVGLPSIILGLVMLATVREPSRRRTVSTSRESYASVGEAMAFLKARWRLYVPLLVAFGAWGLLLYGFFAWTTTYLVRGFAITPAKAGFIFGTLGLLGVVLGSVTVPIVLRWLLRRRPQDAAIMMFALCSTAAAVSIVVVGLAPTLSGAVAGVIAVNFFGTGCSVLPAFIIQAVAPNALRARLMASYLVALSLVGGGLGPPIVAAAAGLWAGEGALGVSMAATAGLFGAVMLLLMLLARPGFASAQTAMTEQSEDKTGGQVL